MESDSSLSSDWDMINPEEIPEESAADLVENDWKFEVRDFVTGSRVEVVHETDSNHLNDTINEADNNHPNVINEADNNHLNLINEAGCNDQEDISNETDIDHYSNILSEENVKQHNDSNSSSDIDVIEEGPEEMHRSGMLISPMAYLSSNSEVGPLVAVPEAAPNTDDGWINFLLTHRLLRNPQFRDYLIIILMSIAVASTMHIYGSPEDKIKLMKEQVDQLKVENTNLKMRVSSKMEDGKFIQNLEEQITDLKVENLKLTSSLQSLILRLEEQTTLFEKTNNMRKKDPYKIEIDKLKEQVNLLKIDNDDLQQQLVRIRYGAYSPYPDGTKETGSGKKEGKPDQKKDRNENSSDAINEEIKKLKDQLYLEVGELKNWKQSIDNIIKQLDEKEKKDQENSSNKKSTREDKKHTKEEPEKSEGEQKFDDWFWKKLKKNFGSTFDGLKFPEFSKYVNGNEKKVQEVFESVGQYFKKAQEKTRKMLNSYKPKGKDDVWDFLGSLRKKWADMREEFFESHYKKGPVPPNNNKDKFSSDSKKPTPSEKKKFAGNVADQRSKVDEETDSIVEQLMKNPRMKHIVGSDPEWQAKIKKFLEEEEKLTENGQKPENSWMFGRAAVRSILREQEEAEGSTNWFLRKKKAANEEGSGLHDSFEENKE